MESDKVSSKRDKSKSMSDVAVCQEMIQEAFPKGRYGSVYAAQYAAFAFLKKHVHKSMTVRRARAIWEGTARRIDGEEKDALRRAKIEEAKSEQADLRKRLAKLDAVLATLDKGHAGFMGEV